MRKIEIIIDAKGQVRLETKGFADASCQDAGRFIENALGEKLSDQPTAERHQMSVGQAQGHQHT